MGILLKSSTLYISHLNGFYTKPLAVIVMWCSIQQLQDKNYHNFG